MHTCQLKLMEKCYEFWGIHDGSNLICTLILRYIIIVYYYHHEVFSIPKSSLYPGFISVSWVHLYYMTKVA